MSAELIPFNQAKLPAQFDGAFDTEGADALISGAGFPVLSIRGSKWRIKVGGEEKPLVDAEGNPLPVLDLVIIKAEKELSKIYYASEYKEGDDSPPTCFSIDGIRPDPAAEEAQCSTCAACEHNVWGSKITPQGNKTKACSDSKRLAVAPASDLRNEAMGGPMLLRVPAASLKDLSAFGRAMKHKGYVPQQIVMGVGFDLEASYPKLTFKAKRPLDEEELMVVKELFDGEQVATIMDTVPENVQNDPAAKKTTKTVDTDFESEPAPSAPLSVGDDAEAKPAKAESKKKEKAKADPEPAAEQSDDDLDDLMGDLDNLDLDLGS